MTMPNWPPTSREEGWDRRSGLPLSDPSEPEFFRVAAERFSIVGPLVSAAQVSAIFPESFPGKEDLVQFYLRFNGGSRTPQGCLISCSSPEHEVPRDQLEKLNVEGFRSIPLQADDRMLPFTNMLKHHAAMERVYSAIPEMQQFCEQHMEIAFDHSGRDLCINRGSGKVFFMDWASYSEGPVEVAPSFHEFVLRFWNVASKDVELG